MKHIAIIAHDKMKPIMVNFLKSRKDWLYGMNPVATGRTAEIMEKNGINITHLSPGKSGGYNEITKMINDSQISAVIFFTDYKIRHLHHEDIQLLLETCDIKNIPIATNPASADCLIIGMIHLKKSK